jgi:transposase-like protein
VFYGYTFKVLIEVMDDLKNFFCWNKECRKYGIRGAENIRVRNWNGKNKDIRLLYCSDCNQKFSERRGTIFSGSRLPKEKTISVMEHIAEGCGVRKTGRLTKTNPATVSRLTKLAGEHAEQLHEELVAFSPSNRRSSVRREVELRVQERKELRRK